MQNTKDPRAAVTAIVVGAGQRGEMYARYALEEPLDLQIVGVAEPDQKSRDSLVESHDIKTDMVFKSWQALAKTKKRLADAVFICVQDQEHFAVLSKLIVLGYDVLLEKPMATDLEQCRQIVQLAEQYDAQLTVCHVLRHTPYTQKIKQLIDEGRIGKLINVQHLEPVGWWHQAHSYVRGNWRNEASSTFMLLAKSCHDLDWLRFIVDSPIDKVQSFGDLYHFTEANQPVGAADRCTDCKVEADCPYSAIKIYTQEDYSDPSIVRVLTGDENDIAGVAEAIENGPYGRCVYKCDNDVVDTQIVNMEFTSGATASFTMTAFADHFGRQTRIFGTHGMIEGDGKSVKLLDFATKKEQQHDCMLASPSSRMDVHGGADYFMMQTFSLGLKDGKLAPTSSPAASLDSHLAAFAAEKSRKTGKVVSLTSLGDS